MSCQSAPPANIRPFSSPPSNVPPMIGTTRRVPRGVRPISIGGATSARTSKAYISVGALAFIDHRSYLLKMGLSTSTNHKAHKDHKEIEQSLCSLWPCGSRLDLESDVHLHVDLDRLTVQERGIELPLTHRIDCRLLETGIG